MGRTRSAAVILVAACGGGGGDGSDAGPPGDARLAPAAEIGFVAGEALTTGEWIVANDWSAPTDTVFALPVADLGGMRRVVFTANRVWSMGARTDGSTIYFASADPNQEADFGVMVGDAIQNTFRYDTATQTVAMVAPAGSGWQNVNDECHEPTADGAFVYICRRYDFDAVGVFLGWRIGRIETAGSSFEFLRPDDPGGPWELGAQPIPSSTRVLYEQRTRPPGSQSSLWTRDLATGEEVMVRADASRPVLAPDGRRVLFQDATDFFRLWVLDLEAPATPPVRASTTNRVGDPAWAPNGQAVVYTVNDTTNNCDHLERVTTNGTTWSAPSRVRDCAMTGEFITDLSWVVVP